MHILLFTYVFLGSPGAFLATILAIAALQKISNQPVLMLPQIFFDAGNAEWAPAFSQQCTNQCWAIQPLFGNFFVIAALQKTRLTINLC